MLPQAGAEPGLEEESPAQAATVERTPRLDWAGLVRRTFALDVLACLIVRRAAVPPGLLRDPRGASMV
ncbi:hypothetical protein D7X99_08470 [Corallococcus sp. AB032C]|uniref:hypothetical protein n=1 Tax=Corallococcus TaxID=83461 RepID=UPI000ED3A5B2|nr:MULTISPECIES: hypothetical protein [Corallococcus]NPC49343.1 hypothetical protein [Corallococcus exiguus]RKH84610.1 hypothetical protein D7X99_08470 [Corallococcus sp. AB032C]